MKYDIKNIGSQNLQVTGTGKEYIINLWLKMFLTQRGTNVFNPEVGTNILSIGNDDMVKECIETATELTREILIKNITVLKPTHMLKTVVPNSIVFDKGMVYIKVTFSFNPRANIPMTFIIGEDGIRGLDGSQEEK